MLSTPAAGLAQAQSAFDAAARRTVQGSTDALPRNLTDLKAAETQFDAAAIVVAKDADLTRRLIDILA